MKRTINQNKKIHQLLTQTCLTEQKSNLVYSFTNNRTGSSSEMLKDEAANLIKHLEDEHNHQRKKMRGKIIHYLCLLGFTDGNGKADFNRIDKFIINIGSNNPRKVILNFLYYNELHKVCTQVEAMYRKEVKK